MRLPVRVGPFRMFVVYGLALAGCGGGDELPRERISGTVTLDGAPLATGDITFMPVDPASTGTAVGATVSNGSYDVPRAEGPVPGAYRVTISSVEEKAPANAKAKPGDGDAPVMKERVPEAYNRKTTLKADVVKEGKNVFDFPLKTK